MNAGLQQDNGHFRLAGGIGREDATAVGDHDGHFAALRRDAKILQTYFPGGGSLQAL
jgi:hypothetical protein